MGLYLLLCTFSDAQRQTPQNILSAWYSCPACSSLDTVSWVFRWLSDSIVRAHFYKNCLMGIGIEPASFLIPSDTQPECKNRYKWSWKFDDNRRVHESLQQPNPKLLRTRNGSSNLKLFVSGANWILLVCKIELNSFNPFPSSFPLILCKTYMKKDLLLWELTFFPVLITQRWRYAKKPSRHCSLITSLFFRWTFILL